MTMSGDGLLPTVHEDGHVVHSVDDSTKAAPRFKFKQESTCREFDELLMKIRKEDCPRHEEMSSMGWQGCAQPLPSKVSEASLLPHCDLFSSSPPAPLLVSACGNGFLRDVVYVVRSPGDTLRDKYHHSCIVFSLVAEYVGLCFLGLWYCCSWSYGYDAAASSLSEVYIVELVSRAPTCSDCTAAPAST